MSCVRKLWTRRTRRWRESNQWTSSHAWRLAAHRRRCPVAAGLHSALLDRKSGAGPFNNSSRLREIFTVWHLRPQTRDGFAISPALKAKILFPPLDFGASTSNDHALVVQLSIENTKICFCPMPVC
jgi:hypothetical protein